MCFTLAAVDSVVVVSAFAIVVLFGWRINAEMNEYEPNKTTKKSVIKELSGRVRA